MQLKKYSKAIKVRHKSLRVDVVVTVEEDERNVREEYAALGIPPDQDKAYFQRFDSGELFVAVTTVEVSAHGVTGSDSLGGCHIHSNNMYNSKPFEDDVADILRDHGMVDNAVRDFVSNLKDAAKRLAPYAS